MPEVYIAGNNMMTSLGFTTDENVENLKNDISGIRLCTDKNLYPTPFWASPLSTERLNDSFAGIADVTLFTRFEKMQILSLTEALKNSKVDVCDAKTLIILSSTKGNIDLLEETRQNYFSPERVYLWETAKRLAEFFGNPNRPLVISNACISGVLAIITGMRLIKAGKYENVIVTGGDILSEFVVSGFQSFQSLSQGPCQPFDAKRTGLNIGEGCGTIILTSNSSLVDDSCLIRVTGGHSSNDANHISGPSRTGDGLYLAIKGAMNEADILPENLDYVSAHGTATAYNDEMEAKALALAGLNHVPVNSLKSYFGHTLGAAGIIESVVCLYSLKQNILFNTKGYQEHGVSVDLNIIKKLTSAPVNSCLKMASGFGGCNAAVVFQKKIVS